jgi:hypothetical protein
MGNLDLTNPEVQNEIAAKLVDLEVCKSNLDTTTTAYNNCAANNHGGPSFWQTPTFMVGDFVVGVGVGAAAACAFHLFGACK